MTAPIKHIYEFGPFRLDVGERVLLRDGRPEPVPPKAFDVLLMLVENSGHIVEKDELMNRVWADSFVEEGNLKVTVSVLRKALEQGSGEYQFIETVPRRGYRFTASVRELSDAGSDLMLLERSRANIIIEEEEEISSERTDQTAGDFRRKSSVEYLMTAIKQHRRGAALVLLALLVLTAGAGYGLYRLFGGKSRDHFETMKLRGLTSSGAVLEASISPDGKYVAYSVDEGGQASLWLRQVDVASGNLQIASGADVRYLAATFSPDGNYLYYVASDKGPELFQVAVLGGPSRKLMEGVASPISFSPDGKQFAFLRRNEPKRDYSLLIANADGSGERQLVAAAILGPPAWSPDGKVIACEIVDREAIHRTSVIEVRVADGSQRTIESGKLWDIGQVAWLGDSSGLIAVAHEQPYSPSQLWHISYPGGEVRRITNDLNDYRGVSLTADSGILMTVRSEQICGLWVAPNGVADRARQIAPGLGRQDEAGGLCWTLEGKLVYESREGGGPGIWITEPDGAGRRQLSDTPLATRPSVSPDGKYIVFGSSRAGHPNIWRMDIDGGNLKQLTNGNFEVLPYCSPDSQWVIYTSVVSGTTLLKVPIDGGEPARLTSKWVRGAVTSPDGRLMVCWYRDERQQDSQIKIAVFPVGGEDPVNVFQLEKSALPPVPAPNYLRWAPDGKSVLYIDTRDGVSNIWSQPLDGGRAAPVTDFTSDLIFSFDWTRDGKQLALARGRESSDIMVITGFR